MTKNKNQKSPPPYLTRYKDYVDTVRKNQPLKEIFPKLIMLDITNRCNMECVMCKRWQWTKKYPELNAEIPTDKLKSLIDEFKTLGIQHLLITGGEPFLRKDFIEIVEYTLQNNILPCIITNGTLISQEIAKKLCNLQANTNEKLLIIFSLDGSRPEIHDRIRGKKNVFNKVIKNIKLIQKYRDRNQFRMKINYTIQTENIDDVFPFVKFVKNLGVDKVMFNVVHGLAQRINKEFMSKLKRFANYLESELENDKNTLFSDRTNIIRSIAKGIIPLKDISRGLPLLTLFKKNPVTCFGLCDMSLIDPQGDVYPGCYALYNRNLSPTRKYFKLKRKYCLGNIYNNSFLEIWSGKIYTELRKKMTNPKAMDKNCSTCEEYFKFKSIQNHLNDYFSSFTWREIFK